MSRREVDGGVFARFDHVLSIEGAYDPAEVEGLFALGEPPLRTGAAEFVGGFVGRLALVSRRPSYSVSFDGQGRLNRPYVGFYVESGTISEREVQLIREGGAPGEGELTIDFAGALSIVPVGFELMRKVEGRGESNMLGFALLRECRPASESARFQGRFEVFLIQGPQEAVRRMADGQGD